MVGTLFRFFLASQVRNRKTLLVVLAGIVPIGISLVLRGLRAIMSDVDLVDFSGFSYFLYLHFLVPLVAMFQGIGIIADEAEDSTLPFLLTRPVPRSQIVLSKYLACVFIGGVAIVVSLLVSYAILAVDGFSEAAASSRVLVLFHTAGVLLIELCVYCIVFLIFGALVRHPTVLALLFVFGWEKVIAYIPGNARYIAIMSYLQALYPSVDLPVETNLLQVFGSVSGTTAIVVLCALLVGLGGFAAHLLRLKEFAK